MNPKIKTALAVLLPLVLAAGQYFMPQTWPAYVHAVALLLAAIVGVANVFHVPASVVAVLQAVVDAADAQQARAAQKPAFAMARKVIGAAALVLVLGAAMGATQTACNASSSQVQTTISDGAKVGVCITVALLSGADPLTCANATEQLVVDVINDVEAKASDAGAAALALTAEQKHHFDDERVRMVARLAAKAPGK